MIRAFLFFPLGPSRSWLQAVPFECMTQSVSPANSLSSKSGCFDACKVLSPVELVGHGSVDQLFASCGSECLRKSAPRLTSAFTEWSTWTGGLYRKMRGANEQDEEGQMRFLINF